MEFCTVIFFLFKGGVTFCPTLNTPLKLKLFWFFGGKRLFFKLFKTHARASCFDSTKC